MAQRLNTVNQFLNEVGGECFKPMGTATTANGLCANASQTVGNMAETLKVAEALAQQAPANEPNFSGGASAGPSAANLVMGAVATAVVTAVNPVAGAVMGAATSLHAGLQSLKPSNQYYNLAMPSPSGESANDASFANNYTDIMGDTYSPTGRLQQPPASVSKMSPIAMAAQKVSSENSLEDIQKDIRTKFKEQLDMLGSTQRALKEKHGMDLGLGDPNLVAAELKSQELTQQRPRPSVNIMGGPAAFGFG